MKKKKWLNKRIAFTIAMIFVGCCLMSTSLWAAGKIDITPTNARGFIKQLNQNGADLGSALGLSPDDGFQLLRQITDFNGVTHYRYQQTYKGIPVWGIQAIVSKERSNNVKTIHGSFIQGNPGDVGSIPASLDPGGALVKMQDLHKATDAGATWNYRNEQAGTFVYFHKKSNKARLCYVVSFFADTECGSPSRPVFFIDVKNGNVIDSFDSLAYAYDGTGPGGNLKIGYYYYGTDYPGFGVTVSDSTCTMNWNNCKTVDLNHGTSGTTTYSYPCYENTHEEINGAYCPLNDAQYFGQAVYDMYNSWYGVPPLPFQLTLRCHYSTNYENAFWDGSSMTFGDGNTTFYPLVALDIIANEVSHGFTEFNSGLIYSGQSGGINEAFSDMAGEACEYYMKGGSDFMCGYDIFKNPGQALRYLYDPPLDGILIDHFGDYYEGMDVHYSSGIFNKAFYLIATSPGWNTKMAFDIFVKANQDYWMPGSTFLQGTMGVMNAAVDLGYPCQDVVNAFAQVGITLVCPGPPIANFSAYPTSGGFPLTVYFTDQSQAASSWSWDFGDGQTSTLQNPVHTYTTMGVYTVTLTVTNESGADSEIKTNYITVTSCGAPIADFTASSTSIAAGGNVTFTDISLENPASWSWTFEGGTIIGGSEQNPIVKYDTAGTYDVKLIVSNVCAIDSETKVDYITVSTKAYCPSQGNTYSMEWIAGVQVGTMNNTSGASGYTDFTNITCNLPPYSTVNVVLTPGFSGGVWTEYWKIWIDYNNDHDFDDAGEEVFSGVGSSTVTGSFTTAYCINDITRMRVSMKYNSYPTPCETFTYGEVEDYTACFISGEWLNADFTASATRIYEGEAVTFTDQSVGSPTPYAWDWVFEGGTPGTGTLQNPTITYNTKGKYTVTLTAYGFGSDTVTKVDYIKVIKKPTEIYVNDITQAIKAHGKDHRSTAAVTILDTGSEPAAKAVVFITWTGVVSGSDTGVTGPDGTVTFQSGKINSTGPFTITVDNVTHPDALYNPALNIETSDTANY